MMSSLFCALGASAALWASTPSLPPLPATLDIPTLLLKDIVPGAQGVCYTVFEGATIEPFAFEVKGVMPNFLGPDTDVLLVRLRGEKPEFTGVVSGMSGSPCLIDGKLVGALAYSFASFAKEPIAGITPIAAMRKLETMPHEARPFRLAQAQADALWPRAGNLAGGAEGPTLVPPPGGLTPIATPLSVGNMVPEVFAQFAPYLRAAGFEPVVAGAARASSLAAPAPGPSPYALRPGSAIGVVLAQGDISMAATGTVTWIDGDQVLAFGHPFNSQGAVSLPMAESHIVNTMASSMHSFKMAIAGRVVGEITQDRLTAISGKLGAAPAMVPVTGVLHTHSGTDSFSFEIARDPTMTPRFVAMATANALTGRVSASARGTATLKATIEVAGAAPIETTYVQAGDHGGTLFMGPALELYRDLEALWDTPFGAPGPLRIRLEATLLPTPVEETIEEVALNRDHVAPHEAVEVAVRLRRATGGTRTERFTVAVPARWRDEELEVVVAGGHEARELLRAEQGPTHPNRYEDILEQVRARPAADQLHLWVVRRGDGLQRGGQHFGNLPPSTLIALGHAPHDVRTHHGIDHRAERAIPGVVHGLVRRTLHVAARTTSPVRPRP